MGKFTKTAGLALTGLGSLVIAAAQTEPKAAISNIGGWLKLAGADDLAAKLPDHIDAIATWIGFALVVVVLLGWLWVEITRLRRRPMAEKDRPKPSLIHIDGSHEGVSVQNSHLTGWGAVISNSPGSAMTGIKMDGVHTDAEAVIRNEGTITNADLRNVTQSVRKKPDGRGSENA